MIEIIKHDELMNINGGSVNFSGAILGSLVKGFNSFLDIGRSLGTSIRRLFSGSLCAIN